MKNNVIYLKSKTEFNSITCDMDAIAFVLYVDKDKRVDSVAIIDNKQYKYYFQERFNIYIVEEAEANGKNELDYWLGFFESMSIFKTKNNINDKSFCIKSVKTAADKNKINAVSIMF